MTDDTPLKRAYRRAMERTYIVCIVISGLALVGITLIIPEIFVFSKRTWDTLTKEDQELVRKLSREAQAEQRQLWDKYVGDAETKLKAAGVQFVEADKAAFYKATQPVRDKYGAKYAALLKRIEDTK